MSQFLFDIANRSDKHQLGRILNEDPMDGDIRISFSRDPDIFQSFGILGEKYQVIVAREKESGKAIGYAVRSISKMYVDEKLTNVGYLSGLRISQKYRNGTLLARGFRYLHELHQKNNDVRLYLATVVENNRRAIGSIFGKRAGIPAFEDLGGIITFGCDMKKANKKWKSNDKLKILKGNDGNIEEVICFVNKCRSSRQFSPYISSQQLLGGEELYRGLRPGNFFVAYRDGKIIGALAKWDQGSFKQNIISGYSRSMSFLFPAYNLWSQVRGYSKLPRIGEQIKTFFISFIAVLEDDPDIFGSLLKAVKEESSSEGYSYMLVGMHEKDDLAKTLVGSYSIQYKSRMLVSFWDDGEADFEKLSHLTPCVEIATL